MKKTLLLLAVAALASCGQKKEAAAPVAYNPAEDESLPTILREHPQLSEFTLLQEENAVQCSLFAENSGVKYHFFNEKNGLEVDPNLFRIENGVVRMDGENGGYVMTDQDFSNFYLRVEVKWGEKSYGKWAERAKNGGIQFGIKSGEDKLWPDNYEYEIMVGALGELWTGREFETPNEVEKLGPSYSRVYCTDKTRELPDNEWNVLEMICFDNKVEHFVNGTKVLEATVPEGMNQGRLLLQYEYTDIYYKDALLIPLK